MLYYVDGLIGIVRREEVYYRQGEVSIDDLMEYILPHLIGRTLLLTDQILSFDHLRRLTFDLHLKVIQHGLQRLHLVLLTQLFSLHL